MDASWTLWVKLVGLSSCIPSGQCSALSTCQLTLLLASQLTSSLSSPRSKPQLELSQQTPMPCAALD